MTRAHFLVVLVNEFLRGGWLEGSKLFYVVRRAGTALTESDADVPYLRPAPAWSARCRAAPLAAARALVECVRSFADAGYFLEDLDGSPSARPVEVA